MIIDGEMDTLSLLRRSIILIFIDELRSVPRDP